MLISVFLNIGQSQYPFRLFSSPTSQFNCAQFLSLNIYSSIDLSICPASLYYTYVALWCRDWIFFAWVYCLYAQVNLSRYKPQIQIYSDPSMQSREQASINNIYEVSKRKIVFENCIKEASNERRYNFSFEFANIHFSKLFAFLFFCCCT